MVVYLDKTNDFIKNILNQASDVCQDYKKTLYHYTNAEGLKSILSEGNIWGTHYKYTNDKTEINYSFELIIESLNKHLKKEKDPRKKELLKKYLKIQQSINESKEKVEFHDIFVASFSEEKDLLSQWRGYGYNGYGYSIGIDLFRTSRKKVGLPLDPVRINKLHLIKLIYQKTMQMKIIDDYIETFIGHLIEDNSNRDSETFMGAILLIFPLIACLLKNPHFKEEKEWRLIYIPSRNTSNNGNIEIDYRVKDNVVIPYVKMDITQEIPEHIIPIKDILIGPKLDEIKVKIGLEMLLKDYRYDISFYNNNLYKSKIPFI